MPCGALPAVVVVVTIRLLRSIVYGGSTDVLPSLFQEKRQCCSSLRFPSPCMTLASAQSLLLPPMGGDMPTTIPLTNISNGEKIGTITVSGNRFYLRDLKGEHFGTVVIERDGTRRLTTPAARSSGER